jgi:hypothetical protein
MSTSNSSDNSQLSPPVPSTSPTVITPIITTTNTIPSIPSSAPSVTEPSSVSATTQSNASATSPSSSPVSQSVTTTDLSSNVILNVPEKRNPLLISEDNAFYIYLIIIFVLILIIVFIFFYVENPDAENPIAANSIIEKIGE